MWLIIGEIITVCTCKSKNNTGIFRCTTARAMSHIIGTAISQLCKVISLHGMEWSDSYHAGRQARIWVPIYHAGMVDAELALLCQQVTKDHRWFDYVNWSGCFRRMFSPCTAFHCTYTVRETNTVISWIWLNKPEACGPHINPTMQTAPGLFWFLTSSCNGSIGAHICNCVVIVNELVMSFLLKITFFGNREGWNRWFEKESLAKDCPKNYKHPIFFLAPPGFKWHSYLVIGCRGLTGST